MAYAILRTAKLKSFGEIGGSLSHTFRTRETPNADPARLQDNEHTGPADPQAIQQAIKDRLPEKYRSDAVLCIEYIVTASPDHFKRDGGRQYFEDATAWLVASGETTSSGTGASFLQADNKSRNSALPISRRL